jgi:Tfp pilus assembly protein PilF
MSTHTSASLAARPARARRPRARCIASCDSAGPCRATLASAGESRGSSSRRTTLVKTLVTCVVLPLANAQPVFASLGTGVSDEPPPVDTQLLVSLFEEAMRAGDDYQLADEAWTKAIAYAPKNTAAWSNRGTKRLQAGRWQDASDDLQRSIDLSLDLNTPDPLTLNNLGNAYGALGRWDLAMASFLEASRDRDLRPIALANFALGKFQVGETGDALKITRTLLRKDPEFWDMRAAQTAFLWAEGYETEAEQEWQVLCSSGRGFGGGASAESKRNTDGSPSRAYAAELLSQQVKQQLAVVTGVVGNDGARRDGRDVVTGVNGNVNGTRRVENTTPCALYASTSIVAPRWPPRCTAALDAFLRLKRVGKALDYDGQTREFEFAGRERGGVNE